MGGQEVNMNDDAINLSRPSHQPFGTVDMHSARRYDAWYETPAGKQMADAEEALLGACLARFPDAHSVLEIGCGTGHFSRWFAWFASHGLQVTGVDRSAGMLAVARERGAGPSYVDGAAEQLPFPDSNFDLAVFVTSLEFVSEPVTALREAGRVACMGLLLGVLNLASPLGLLRKVGAALHPSPYRTAHSTHPGNWKDL